jgi:hypothetical protein
VREEAEEGGRKNVSDRKQSGLRVEKIRGNKTEERRKRRQVGRKELMEKNGNKVQGRKKEKGIKTRR